MPPCRELRQLQKLLAYILGRRPDEFGLVPDDEGFVRIKELLQSITEEDGWRHVRRAHIDEIFWAVPDPQLEIKAESIRFAVRDLLPRPASPQNLPKILYTCVRRKAHLAVLEKGIFPMGRPGVLLSCSSEMARRIGRRRDARPVLLTVNARKMSDRGLGFLRFGELLYLTDTVPVDCFSGPAPEKQKVKSQREADAAALQPQPAAGSFFLDLSAARPVEPSGRGKHGKREVAWKRDRRLRRKRKDGGWADQ